MKERRRPVGWRREPARHALAGKGIASKTVQPRQPSAMHRTYRTRVELYCGMDESVPARKRMYERAQKVADQFGIETYFDEHEEHGHLYADGYVYPRSDNILATLKALDTADVDYDNIDIPDALKNTHLHVQLEKRHPKGRGVSVNPGEIREEVV